MATRQVLGRVLSCSVRLLLVPISDLFRWILQINCMLLYSLRAEKIVSKYRVRQTVVVSSLKYSFGAFDSRKLRLAGSML